MRCFSVYFCMPSNICSMQVFVQFVFNLIRRRINYLAKVVFGVRGLGTNCNSSVQKEKSNGLIDGIVGRGRRNWRVASWWRHLDLPSQVVVLTQFLKSQLVLLHGAPKVTQSDYFLFSFLLILPPPTHPFFSPLFFPLFFHVPRLSIEKLQRMHKFLQVSQFRIRKPTGIDIYLSLRMC